MDAIDLIITSRLEHVYLIGLAVRGICQGLPLTTDDVDALELAVCEAANNCIEHAYEGCPDKTVRVSVVVDKAELVIRFTDQGKPIPRKDGDGAKLGTQLPLAQTIADLPEGGMGLFLIRNAADSLEYTAGPPDNTLVIRKAFPPKSE